jgi:tetratricopeptide (TPR) repeat protein
MLFRRTPSVNAAWEKAQALLQADRTAEAESLLTEALKNTSPNTEAYYSGVEYLATVQFLSNMPDRSMQTLLSGCAQPEPADKAARKQRLTLLMNAGELLLRQGHLEEAEQVLRQGLEGRGSFYGTAHAGYAFGLEPLADVVLAQGKTAEAATLYEQALQIFQTDRHPRALGALARVLLCQKLTDPTTNPYETASMPKEGWEELASATIGLTGQFPGDKAASALWDLQKQLAIQLGEGHALREAALTLLSNKERESGHHAGSQKALKLLANLYHSQSQHEPMLEAMMALAMSQSEAGEHDAAQTTYQDVLDRAIKRNLIAIQVRALRNQGLHLAEIDRREEAEVALRQAVALGLGIEGARAKVALGIFLQHGGELTEAEPLLSQALAELPPDASDTFPARSHLNAIKENRSCGCGDGALALREGFQTFLETQLPPEFQGSVKVDFVGESMQVQVERALDEEEARRLHLVLQHALATYLERMTSS